ncbi:MAG: SAM-dependent methyltransferase [Lachnospiraceae bacterium]|nr:SAM-dependent methyltransferase [Lachnospiraceae bacterium]
MIALSKRMQALANLVSPCKTFCDVGTDHGFLPIYLVQAGVCENAIAMDLRMGPLDRAKKHIQECNLSDSIETRLSDGVQKLGIREAESVLIAGMGGSVTIHILTEGLEVCKNLKELILQPQSEIDEVRKFVFDQGFLLLSEDIVEEDGKFYPMMKLVHRSQLPDEKVSGLKVDLYSEAELLYGPLLLKMQHPVLKEFLKKEMKREEKILLNLPDIDEDRITERRKIVENKIHMIHELLK